MQQNINYKSVKPCKELNDFVDSFWMLSNQSDIQEELIVFPNGLIDLAFYKSPSQSFNIILLGVETHFKPSRLLPEMSIFAVSFKPLAIEYMFQNNVGSLLNASQELPSNFWNFNSEDLDNFEDFCQKATQKILSHIPHLIDSRKKKLFELIFTKKGTLNINELPLKVFWSNRQINRYFKEQFGLTLKAYCNIIRFATSLGHIKDGKLSPKLSFTDQSHFIKEIKKFSGVSPKELYKNENARFIQISVLKEKTNDDDFNT